MVIFSGAPELMNLGTGLSAWPWLNVRYNR